MIDKIINFINMYFEVIVVVLFTVVTVASIIRVWRVILW